MVGGGPFRLKPGQWTDDTSMALCLAASLVERGGFDADDQMSRYCRWQDEGYMSSTGSCFDIGNTVRGALDRYREDGHPYAGSVHLRSAGNGCLMRLAPVALHFFPDLEAVERHSAESSRTTHGAEECVDACRLFGRILCRALLGQPREEVLLADADTFRGAESLVALARGDYRGRPESEIEGSGYVVRSLEAALWSFDRTDSYEDAILTAVNLGGDADTTAAICGQIAGAYYGETGIPAPWLERLARREEIALLADRLGEKDG
jgi:ADP-ribosyl-[dinitrogen reductase] hydrolase